MKKKLLTLVLLFSVCLAAFITGCGVDDVNEMKFTTSPATTFTQYSEVNLTFDLEIKVDGKTKTINVEYKANGKAYVNGEVDSAITVDFFDLKTLGEKIAIVKYKVGDSELSLSFAYTVVPSTQEFAGGTGTEKDPYKVATPTQFNNMLNKVNKYAYFVLVNDIDFANVTIATPTAYELVAQSQAFTGVVDGNGYILKNVKNAQFDKASNKYMTIFGVVGNFTLKDITVDFAVDETCQSPVSAIVMSGVKDSKLNFENVDVTGYTDGKVVASSGFAPYVTFMGRKQTDDKKVNADPEVVNFKNCTNSISMYNTNGRNAVAGFAITGGTDVQVNFDGCKFNGYIEGASKALGAFYANNGAGNIAKATIVNCSIGGSFVNDGEYVVAPIGVQKGKTATANAALSINAASVKKVPNSIVITNDGAWKLAKVDGVVSYAVVVTGSMIYNKETNSSGACTYQHNITVAENGAFEVYKIKFNENEFKYNEGEFDASETNPLKLSALLKLENGVLNYYGKGVCVDVNFTKATVKVLGYDASGKIVAYGNYANEKGVSIIVDLDAIKDVK